MMKISRVAEVLKAEWRGADVSFDGVSTDTRSIRQGNLFFALSGEKFDAHDFLAQAVASGAVAVVVNRWVDGLDVAQIRVEDTRLALGAWAGFHRAQFSPRVVAVTGSCGKTSVKEMMAAMLAEQGKVLATQGNLNNDIGVPLTLLALDGSEDFAVVELGANHVGEIAYTSALTRPHVALITNVGDAHLEGFGSRENISLAKSEIYAGLVEGGVAVINLDDAFSGDWLRLNAQRKCRTFSVSNAAADVYARHWGLDEFGRASMSICVDGETANLNLGVLGKHQIANALGAIAAVTALGLPFGVALQGLGKLKPFKGRMFPRQLGQWRWIEDSYNANPTSMSAAIEFLAALPAPRTLVLGRMGELGADSAQLHAAVGAAAARAGLETVITCADGAGDYRRGYEQAGGVGKVIEAATHADAARLLLATMPQGAVLVKGSRSAAMENVFEEAARLLPNGEKN